MIERHRIRYNAYPQDEVYGGQMTLRKSHTLHRPDGLEAVGILESNGIAVPHDNSLRTAQVLERTIIESSPFIGRKWRPAAALALGESGIQVVPLGDQPVNTNRGPLMVDLFRP